MNNLKKIISLKYYITLPIIIFIFLILSGISIFDLIILRKTLISNFDSLIKQTENNIINAIKMRDNGFKMLDKALEEKMEKGFGPFIEEYERKNRDPAKMDLESVKQKIGGIMELYIIDEKGVIRYSTFKDVIGLDLSQFGILDLLTEIRLGNKWRPDRINIDVVAGDSKKWAYMPSPDHKYLFELGLISNEFNQFMMDLDPLLVVEQLKKLNPMLQNINLFDPSGFLIGDPNYKLSEEQIDIIKKLSKTKSFFEIKRKNIYIKYIYVNLLEKDALSDPSVILEIIYNKDLIDKKLFKETVTKIIISLIFIFIGLIITTLISFLLSQPILNIIKEIDFISQGNFDKQIDSNSNRELKQLCISINRMVSTIKESYKQIEIQNKQIKEYNENLEMLVKKRTEELEKSNESLKKAFNKIKEDLQIAKKIQEAIIPKFFPIKNSINIEGKYLPMEELGGDFYNVFNIDDDKIGVVIADVCGHGVAAALIASMALISFNINSQKNISSGEIVRIVNNELYKVIGGTNYLTAFYSIIDLKRKEILYTNAAHVIIFIHKKKTNELIPLIPNGPFIGFIPDYPFSTNNEKIESGDRIILYTDGIIETKDSNNNLFDTKFKETILRYNDLSSKELINKIFEELKKYNQDFIQDDLSMLVIDIY